MKQIIKWNQNYTNFSGQDVSVFEANISWWKINIASKEVADTVRFVLWDKRFTIVQKKEGLDYIENVFDNYEKYLKVLKEIKDIESSKQIKLLTDMSKITYMLNSRDKPFSLAVKKIIMRKFKLSKYKDICEDFENVVNVFEKLKQNSSDMIDLHKKSLDEKIFDDSNVISFIKLLENIVFVLNELIFIYRDRITNLSRIIRILG